MKLLLKAALYQKKYIPIVIASLISLMCLTLASSLEMLAVGVLSGKGEALLALKTPQTTFESGFLSSLQEKISEIKKSLCSQQLTSSFSDWTFILSVLIAMIVFKALALFYSRFFTQVLSVKISKDLRERYFQHLQKLPMQFYEKYNIGTLASRVGTDAAQIAISLNAFLTNYFHTPFRIALALILCFSMSWQLSLVIFIGIPLVVFPVIILTKKVKKITRELQKNQEKFTTVLIDFLAGIQTVKIFAMEAFTFKKYKEQNDLMERLEIKTARYDLLIRPILHTITIVCVLGMIFFGLYVLKMTLSELLMFCGFLHQFYEPVKKFSEENAIIQKGSVAAERLFEVLNIDPCEEKASSGIKFEEFKESLEFDHVWFKYEERWILKDVSFSVKKGETLAIVGATGAGKSTIVNLLPRLYDIQKGEIRLDGIPIERYTKSSLREAFSFVPQKPFLFFDTIKANINYGKDFSLERMELAAQRAQAEEFIQLMPKKYDTLLAEAGKNLSGGQQQRLAIARALVKQAPILILDEATSSLDAISEMYIKKAISSLHGSITQIIIAHRLSTIEHADRILFLEKGELKGLGTKEDLLHSCKEFKLMWETHYALSDEDNQEPEVTHQNLQLY
jgi:ABC-type multidrug transport system fused ATPase/permease subunit